MASISAACVGSSSPAAAALAQHRGNLFLDRLEHLPARLAIHLARHRGHLHLHGPAALPALPP